MKYQYHHIWGQKNVGRALISNNIVAFNPNSQLLLGKAFALL